MNGPGPAPVHVVPYDPAWPSRFAEERARLEPLLAPWLAGDIEHVGSTAIPGLCAKPIIDIMAPVHGLDACRDAIQALTEHGYHYYPYRAHVMHWFCKPSPWLRTHHLHLVRFEGRLWAERIAFRDRLRDDAELASEYAELKRALARKHEHDREAYTAAKAPFVMRVVMDALGPPGEGAA